ncbi:hypothetical protein [Nisaea denitrificans]|uniref:hypothetical protein n=1 Tax=Nisaea denitrificans TaxID=390877 RepID=UPI00048F0105|nr:hypothetical protein [Nisaea denitrificans]
MAAIAILNWASIIAGMAAAGLWFWSSIVKVPPDPESQDFQIIDTGHGKDYDVLETARVQTVWNSRAALATGVAVAAQAIALLLPSISN